MPILKIDGLTLTESGAICEYIEETASRSGSSLPTDPRAYVPRCGAWWRGSTTEFHHEGGRRTSSMIRVNKKIMRAGLTRTARRSKDRRVRAIKFHLRYMEWLLDHRRWLAGGDRMTLASISRPRPISAAVD